MKDKANVLVVDDSETLLELYRLYLEQEPYRLHEAQSATAAIKLLDEMPTQAVLLDLNLPDRHGFEVLRHIQTHGLSCPVVVVSGHGSVDTAVKAMREGAFDFIEKPFTQERLLITLGNALEKQRLAHLVETFQAGEATHQYHRFIGESLPMQAVYRTIQRAASSKATVFITGESGTGKELCAEAVHWQSPRRDAPFVPVNCAAIPHDLMESELFGHVKGAFTGAHSTRIGAAARADGGTLFLDEIGELGLDLQTKLLRFLQTGSFSKVGGNELETVDVRIICATNRDPRKEVEAGRFREDLFYRLHVVPVHLPPLRERGRDILLLAHRLLHEFCREEGKHFESFSTAAEEFFKSYDWPGNVRELQNVIRNVVVLHNGGTVTPAMLPIDLKRSPPKKTLIDSREPAMISAAANDCVAKPLWKIEKEAIEHAISACHGNIPRAAALLEVSPSTIYRKLKHWEANGLNLHKMV